MEVLVMGAVVTVQGADFTVMLVTDISAEKRRKALEGIFFHDILNTAGGVLGLIELMQSSGAEIEVIELIGVAEGSARQLIEEILSQRALIAAENSELTVDLTPIQSMEVLEGCDVLPLTGYRRPAHHRG